MKVRNILSSIILILILTLTVGFSAFVSEMSISNLVAEVRLHEDVRITGVSVVSSVNGGMNSLDYDENSIIGNINLKGANSTVTLEVEITNFGNTYYGIYGIFNYDNVLYKQLDGYEYCDMLCDENGKCNLGSVSKFNVTIGYDYYDAVNKNHELRLDFDFKKFYSVTYSGIDNNNYPNYVMEGQDLIFELTGDLPKAVEVYSDGVSYSSFDYAPPSLCVYSVFGNIEIKEKVPVAKLVSGTLTDPGSEVCIKDECFYIISNDGTAVAMLAKYNLYVGNIVDSNLRVTAIENPTGIQDGIALGNYNDTFPYVASVQFSTDTQKCERYTDYNGSLIKTYVDNYALYLETHGAELKNWRLITKSELDTLGCQSSSYTCKNAPSWVTSSAFWTETAETTYFIWAVYLSLLVDVDVIDGDVAGLGVRPVIEISLEEISE